MVYIKPGGVIHNLIYQLPDHLIFLGGYFFYHGGLGHMKRIAIFLTLFISTTAIAHTINWYVDGNILHTTTCESGDDITPPTAPEKYGYTFQEWLSYTPIEYLESTGIQWIDTEYKPNGLTSIEIEAQFLKINNISWIFGSREGPSKNIFTLGVNGNQYIFGYANNIGNGFSTIPVTDINKHFFKHDKGACYIDKTRYDYKTTDFQTQYNLYLFANNYTGNMGKATARIYNCKIYDNDFLIRDFIPVLDKNGTPCLLDLVEKKFYYNAGAGDFIAGPIISETNE